MESMTAEEFLALVAKPRKKRSKYGAIRTRGYDSGMEADYADQVAIRLAAGDLKAVERQPEFHLGVEENVYRADFRLTNIDGSVVIVDVKGHQTPKFKRDVKLWKSYGPYPLHIVIRKGRGWQTTVIPKGLKT